MAFLQGGDPCPSKEGSKGLVCFYDALEFEETFYASLMSGEMEGDSLTYLPCIATRVSSIYPDLPIP